MAGVPKAFHVVCPSLPGYGFSAKPTQTGWGVERIAKAWNTLMQRLGYSRYFAPGRRLGLGCDNSDWPAKSGSVRGHTHNMPNAGAPKDALANPDDRDKVALAGARYYAEWGAGYSKQQSTRPQTLGYGLADSPMGQAAWIIEKFYEWTDCHGHPENALSRQELIDNVMFYWLPGTAASSARLYWESFGVWWWRGAAGIFTDRLQYFQKRLWLRRAAGRSIAIRILCIGMNWIAVGILPPLSSRLFSCR